MIAGLANHLWQSTLVAGLAWVVTLALRRDRASVRYGVWLAASLKFFVPFVLLTGLATQLPWRPFVSASATRPYNATLDAVSQPFSLSALGVAAQPATAPATAGAAGGLLPVLLVIVWMLGAAVLCAVWIIRWRRVRAVVRSSVRIESGPVFDAVRRLERAAEVRRPLGIVSSDASLEPGVFGILAPTLIWPTRMHEHLSPEQVEAILAHEMMHARRHDNLGAALHMATQAAFWFHPVVWWLGMRLVDERERACDEAVVSGGSQPETYAESILKTCRIYTASPVACVSGVTGSDLKKRIEHIMTNSVRPSLPAWKKCLLGVAASSVVLAPVFLGMLHAQPVLAQAEAGTDAAFDVTSVKPNNTGSGTVRMMPAANGGWQAINVTPLMLVRMAYQLEDSRIVGGPAWLVQDRFDVAGVGAAPGRNGPLLAKMRTLLADRFHLVTHAGTRDLPFYKLVLVRRDGRLGSQLTLSTDNCSRPSPARGLPANLPPPPPPPPAPGERVRCGLMVGLGRLETGGQTMEAFARSLSRFVGGIVVDKTDLNGAYDATLTFAPDPALLGRGELPPQLNGAPPPAAITDRPSIFTAIEEQLGLKLEASKGPVDVLVIDSAEKPTDN